MDAKASFRTRHPVWTVMLTLTALIAIGAVLSGCSDENGEATGTATEAADATTTTKATQAGKPKGSPPQGRQSKTIRRDGFNGKWPFTVKSGVLRCKGDSVTFVANGHVYAVNGTAMSRHEGNAIELIWRKGTETPRAIYMNGRRARLSGAQVRVRFVATHKPPPARGPATGEARVAKHQPACRCHRCPFRDPAVNAPGWCGVGERVEGPVLRWDRTSALPPFQFQDLHRDDAFACSAC